MKFCTFITLLRNLIFSFKSVPSGRTRQHWNTPIHGPSPVFSVELYLEGWDQGKEDKHIKSENSPLQQRLSQTTHTFQFQFFCSPETSFYELLIMKGEVCTLSGDLPSTQKCWLSQEPIKPQHKNYLKPSWRSDTFTVLGYIWGTRSFLLLLEVTRFLSDIRSS